MNWKIVRKTYEKYSEAAFTDPDFKALAEMIVADIDDIREADARATTGSAGLCNAFEEWADRELTLETLLSEHGITNMTYYKRFSPGVRVVVRSAFTTQEAITKLGLDLKPQEFHAIFKGHYAWEPPGAKMRARFGRPGRWWVRRQVHDFEHHAHGFSNPLRDQLPSIDHLV